MLIFTGWLYNSYLLMSPDNLQWFENIQQKVSHFIRRLKGNYGFKTLFYQLESKHLGTHYKRLREN